MLTVMTVTDWKEDDNEEGEGKVEEIPKIVMYQEDTCQ